MKDPAILRAWLSEQLEAMAEPLIIRTPEQMLEVYRKMYGADHASYDPETNTIKLGYLVSPKAELIKITITKVNKEKTNG